MNPQDVRQNAGNDNPGNDDQLPQPMGRQAARPGKQPADDVRAVSAIERQEKIDQLRTREDLYEQYDDDRPKPSKFRKFLRFLGWMLLIVVLTAGGAFAGWYFWLRKEPPPAKPAVVQEQPAAPAAEAEAEPVNTHNSSAFLLRFDYPQTWKVTEGADNKIVAVSPPTELRLAGGRQQTGQITMTIQRKQISLPEFTAGPATAIRESEKIDYAKPSQAQRASTYISYLKYAASTANGIDGIHVTGDNGYKAQQLVPQADIVKSDPLIAITFRACNDAKCAAVVSQPATLAASAWDDTAFSKPLKTMLQSIVAD